MNMKNINSVSTKTEQLIWEVAIFVGLEGLYFPMELRDLSEDERLEVIRAGICDTNVSLFTELGVYTYSDLLHRLISECKALDNRDCLYPLFEIVKRFLCIVYGGSVLDYEDCIRAACHTDLIFRFKEGEYIREKYLKDVTHWDNPVITSSILANKYIGYRKACGADIILLKKLMEI